MSEARQESSTPSHPRDHRESHPTNHLADHPVRRGGWWVTVALLLGVVLIFAVSFALAPRPQDGEVEAFGGTDSAVTDILAEDGAQPWFAPIFQPGSGEIESGLFALQAALGAGLFGFALGRLSARRRPHLGQPAEPGPGGPADGASREDVTTRGTSTRSTATGSAPGHEASAVPSS